MLLRRVSAVAHLLKENEYWNYFYLHLLFNHCYPFVWRQSKRKLVVFQFFIYVTIVIFLFDLSHRRVMDKLFIQPTFFSKNYQHNPHTSNHAKLFIFLFVCMLSTNNIVSNVLKSNNYKPLRLQKHSLHFTCLGEKNVNKRILCF